MAEAAAPGAPRRPSELMVAASVARRFYLDGRSKKEIAEEFGLSRFKIARILDDARSSGLVRIEISLPGALDAGLSTRLQDAFGLRRAIVVDVSEDGDVESLRGRLGEIGAELLTELVGADDVLGLAWGRSLNAMSRALTTLAPCTVVQLTGALSGPGIDENSIDLVRAVARTAGGRAFAFYAPFILPDPAAADVLRRQPEVARAFGRFGSITKAVIAIGSWDPPYSTVYDALDERDRDELRRSGVCAELSGVFLDADGRLLSARLTDRMIGITGEELRIVPEVMAIAYGTVKAPAVRAALRSGLVTSLVTHSALAARLLEPDGDDAAQVPGHGPEEGARPPAR